MLMATGISGAGRKVERRFRELTGATPTEVSKGDALLNGHLIEVKQASKNTINQVRAVKY